MLNLNERAAKVLRWKLHEWGFYVNRYDSDTGFGPMESARVNRWNPREDYNHARLLYQQVVEKGLKRALEHVLVVWLQISVNQNTMATGLDLTAEQLTIACCEVLEAHDG